MVKLSSSNWSFVAALHWRTSKSKVMSNLTRETKKRADPTAYMFPCKSSLSLQVQKGSRSQIARAQVDYIIR